MSKTKTDTSPIAQKIGLEKKSDKAKRGRPRLMLGTVGTYEHVQLSTQKLMRTEFFKQKPLLHHDALMNVMREVLTIEAIAVYYWKLVYSTAFEELQQKKNGYTLKRAAKEAGVPYHNIKKIYAGKGSSLMAQRYLLFLHLQGINIQEVRLRQEIISEAYIFYLDFVRGHESQ